jgi:hypothetical protein
VSDQAPALDEIAERLYAMHPDGFAAARDEQIKQARAEGQRDLARALGQLRKPTLSAWMVNLLWRNQREAMQQLFGLAEGLTAAQANASGEALRALIGHRRQFEGALLRTAELLARHEGVDVTPAMSREVQATLAAALANPAVAEEVRTGRLVKPFGPNGFGEVMVAPITGVAPRPAPPRPSPIRPAPTDQERATPAPGRGDTAARREPAEEEAERGRAEAAARAARREQAARRMRAAEEAVAAAAEALADDTRAAEAANDLHQALIRRVDRLRDQLRELEEEAAAAETTANAAVRRRDRSEQAHAAALEALAEAARAVAE